MSNDIKKQFFNRLVVRSNKPLKISDERVQAYIQKINKCYKSCHLEADSKSEVDPYAFDDGDEEFSFPDKKDKQTTESDPGRKHAQKVSYDKCFH